MRILDLKAVGAVGMHCGDQVSISQYLLQFERQYGLLTAWQLMLSGCRIHGRQPCGNE